MVTFLKSHRFSYGNYFIPSTHNNENSGIVFAEFRLLIFKMPAFCDLPFAPNYQVKFWFTELHIAYSDLRASTHIKRASEAAGRDDVTKPFNISLLVNINKHDSNSTHEANLNLAQTYKDTKINKT